MKNFFIIIMMILISINVMKSDWGLFGTLVTNSITDIGPTTATVNSTINLLDKDKQVTQKGVVWSTNQNPTYTSYTGGGLTSQGTGCGPGPCSETYISNVTGLNRYTNYYIRSYIINDDGTFYSPQVSFTTIPFLPTWGLIAFGSLTLLLGGFFVRKIFL